MTTIILINISAVLVILWGLSHLFPTKNVVKGFGEITEDNKRIITMKWIIEGVSLIFIGLLLIGVTLISSEDNLTANFIYWTSSVMLIVLAIISLFTGARINFLPYRLCPIIFTGSAILIMIGITI